MRGGPTLSGQQPRSLGGRQEGPPSPWAWAETAGRSLPQTPSDHLLLGCKLHLLQQRRHHSSNLLLSLKDGTHTLAENALIAGDTDVFYSMLPLPMMTKGLFAVFSTEMASATAPWSAKLTGGSGQQETTLQKPAE